MKRVALTLSLALFATTANAQYYGSVSSPCASGNCSLANAYSNPLSYSATVSTPVTNYSSPCASGNCPISNSYVPEPAASPCASGNCSLASYSAATEFGIAQVSGSSLIPAQNSALPAYANSPCANGNCSLMNYSYAPATAVSPCASGNCSLAYGGFAPQATATQATSPCANGNCSIAEKTIPVSCLLYTSPSPRDATLSRMPSSA